MSRGPGKTQRNILFVLGQNLRWESIDMLAIFAYHMDYFYDGYEEKYRFVTYGMNDQPKATRAEIVATHRAVNQLERLGQVETKITPIGGSSHRGGQGGMTRVKEVRIISVDSMDNLP